ncbi:unnamed protein product [Rotaria sp. Silwood1]|nr:unnamed protein product [Rotaria sp. Silwood1]
MDHLEMFPRNWSGSYDGAELEWTELFDDTGYAFHYHGFIEQNKLWDFDERVKRRNFQTASETDSILAQIIEETQQSQQELLISVKEYRSLLEELIEQLAFIQEQLQQ